MGNISRGCATALLLIATMGAARKPHRQPLPADGVVPDEATAVRIAEAIFPPIFGEEEIGKFRPYHAQLTNGVWTVYGTLKRGSRGGTPMVRMRKLDARVLEIWYSQ
jgi:hypothetical protein